MATRDGKYFGKSEIEWVYDFMEDHKDMGIGETIHAVITKFDLAADEATEYVTFCRKERRKVILERADIKHFCESLVEKSGTAIMRDSLIKIVKDGWNVDQVKAAEYIDAAIDEIKDPQKRLIFYDDWESLSAAITKKVGTVGDTVVIDSFTAMAEHKAQETLRDLGSIDEAIGKTLSIKVGGRQEGKTVASNDKLSLEDRIMMDVFEEGRAARDSGASSPYRPNTFFHWLHVTGWVYRDLERGLATVKDTYKLQPLRLKKMSDADFSGIEARIGTFYGMDFGSEDAATRQRWETIGDATPRHGQKIKGELSWVVGTPVEKQQGYRFPGEVISEFRTRKGKLRYVVEGIADGNDECLHIFSAKDLRELQARHGWVYRLNGVWKYGRDTFPDNAERASIRPATEAEKSFWKRA